jgi:phospholipid transport system substrate-binding protein
MKISMEGAKKLGFVAVLCLAFVSSINAGEPLQVVKTAEDKAIEILKDPKLQGSDKKKERIERLKEAVNPIFDYEEMAKRTLGSHWRRRSPAEQQEFVRLFRDFLEKIYSDKVDLYEGQKVVFGRETIDNDFAEVESTVIGVKGDEYFVLYKFRRADGKWRVYDAVIENISMVNNYRSQFDRVIAKSSYDELKRMLKEKAG